MSLINFAHTVLEQSHAHPDKIAYRDGYVDLKYGDIPKRVRQIAHGLTISGLRRGDHVIIQMEDCVDWPCTFLACLYANIIPLPLSGNLGPDLFAKIAEFIECKLIITRDIVQNFYNLTDHVEPVMVHPDSAAWMNVSSGSTGMPKVAVHRHQTLFEILKLSPRLSFGMTHNSTILSVAKMSWNFGLHNSVTYTMGLGATAILIPDAPAAPVVFEYLNRYRPEIVISSPSIIRRLLLPAVSKYTLPDSIEHFNSSGEHLPDIMYDQFLERFGIQLHSCIGMMETCTNYAANSDFAHDRGTVGQALPGCEIKLVDDEIYVSSPANACYYYKNYEKTKQTFIGEWVRTGDRGYYNERGNLVFGGRVDDVFKVNDLIVNPVEIESEILKDSTVDQVAIAKVVNSRGTNEVHAFIVPQDNFDIVKFKETIKEKLFPHQIPQQIHIVEKLAETATNKKHRRGMVNSVTTLP
ncbi:Acs Acyl-coenzyme A synthetases/AMP-(fatty) acid ligases [uncultured Caudovirales phage]|uniref:Acs Acyl-coenzyme A synthetases/AMP-(Fatty) acid ligases n=1 Tax=uncultured Caudovirales phage TaxID=2100421 RepID=A0A6J5L563_9CAUD|nr:Acs Acyl-coenzyme A synthetases/AMP-(fatty) acid ligases [uncultured Caudovirales phage]